MIFNHNMLCFGMHHMILEDSDGVGVIAKDGIRLIELDLKILQSSLHPKSLRKTSCYRTYSGSVVDSEIEYFFLLNYETRKPPRQNAAPLVLL